MILRWNFLCPHSQLNPVLKLLGKIWGIFNNFSPNIRTLVPEPACFIVKIVFTKSVTSHVSNCHHYSFCDFSIQSKVNLLVFGHHRLIKGHD